MFSHKHMHKSNVRIISLCWNIQDRRLRYYYFSPITLCAVYVCVSVWGLEGCLSITHCLIESAEWEIVWILMVALALWNISRGSPLSPSQRRLFSLFDYVCTYSTVITQISPVVGWRFLFYFLFWSHNPGSPRQISADIQYPLTLVPFLFNLVASLSFFSLTPRLSFDLLLTHAIQSSHFPFFFLSFRSARILSCLSCVCCLMFHSVTPSVVPLDLLFFLFSFSMSRCFILLILLLLLHFISLTIKCKELNSGSFFYLIEFFINWVSCPCDSAFIYKWCSFSFLIHSLSLRKYWFLEWPLAHVSVKKNYVENDVSKTSMPSSHHPTFWSHRVNKRRGGRTGIRLHVLLFYREALDYYYHFMPL